MLFNERNDAVKFIDDYGLMILVVKRKCAEKTTKNKGLQILSPKQMLQRLPIALTQVKAGKTSESLLNEIKQIIHSVHRSKEVTKKVYNHIMNSIKV